MPSDAVRRPLTTLSGRGIPSLTCASPKISATRLGASPGRQEMRRGCRTGVQAGGPLRRQRGPSRTGGAATCYSDLPGRGLPTSLGYRAKSCPRPRRPALETAPIAASGTFRS
jgi:hypothetical protein